MRPPHPTTPRRCRVRCTDCPERGPLPAHGARDCPICCVTGKPILTQSPSTKATASRPPPDHEAITPSYTTNRTVPASATDGDVRRSGATGWRRRRDVHAESGAPRCPAPAGTRRCQARRLPVAGSRSDSVCGAGLVVVLGTSHLHAPAYKGEDGRHRRQGRSRKRPAKAKHSADSEAMTVGTSCVRVARMVGLIRAGTSLPLVAAIVAATSGCDGSRTPRHASQSDSVAPVRKMARV
jgi:hypothetical protein